MNWESIKENYPKAIGKYETWLTGHLTESGHVSWCHCNILKFFDEQGIYIETTIETKGRFILDIVDWEAEYLHNGKIKNFRTEAETEAFEKAFEILEKQMEES